MNSPPSTARSSSTRSGRNGLAYPKRETPWSSVRWAEVRKAMEAPRSFARMHKAKPCATNVRYTYIQCTTASQIDLGLPCGAGFLLDRRQRVRLGQQAGRGQSRGGQFSEISSRESRSVSAR